MTRDTENLFEMGGITDGLQCPVKEGFTVLSRYILPPSFFPCHFMFEPAKDLVKLALITQLRCLTFYFEEE